MTLNSQKRYKSAPLPFIGQKRNFIKYFEKVLTENITDDGADWIIIDVFGGSGLLAHNAKIIYPKSTVIYNDFDGYVDRLNGIDDTNRLRKIILNALKNHERGAKLSTDAKNSIIDKIYNFNGFVDVQCIARWLLFSGQQVKTVDELITKSFYNRVTLHDYNALGYLDGLIVTQKCYKELLPEYFNRSKTLFLIDPPYLYTGQGAYAMDKYFAMIDFLKLMSFVRPPYIFFSSTKSELLDYMDFLRGQNNRDWARVGNFNKQTITANVNYAAKYEDHMIYKF